SGSKDKTLKLWDVRTGQDLLTLKGHAGGVTSVAFSPDGLRIASIDGEGTLKLWDAPTEQHARYFKGHLDAVTQLAVATNGKRVLGGAESGKVFSWDVDTGRLLPDPPTSMPRGSGPTATFGEYRASPYGNLVRVERVFTAEEEDRRKLEQARIESILRA